MIETRLSSSLISSIDDIISPSDEIRINVRDEMKRCEGDIVYWINTYCFTFDPRLDNSIIPFNLFEKQAEFIHWLEDCDKYSEGGIVEKSL